MENIKYGRRWEGRWTPIQAKAQDTIANPNSWETHLVRKRWDIGLLRALSPKIMMMMMMLLLVTGVFKERVQKTREIRWMLTLRTMNRLVFGFVVLLMVVSLSRTSPPIRGC